VQHIGLVIDTEKCTNCGVCYEVQTMWVVENSTNGYPYWVHGEGGFEGLLYYWYPTTDHIRVIQEDLIPNCPGAVFALTL
jgi:dissimilatory sulfite reductase (desulfoviridin) alpha/beta subunit